MVEESTEQRAKYDAWVRLEVEKGFLCGLGVDADVMWLAWQAAIRANGVSAG